MKKAQSTIQFMFLVGFMLLLLLGFVSYESEKMSNMQEEKEYVLLKDLGYKISSEFNIAATSHQGYTRKFVIPNELDGVDYNLSQQNNIILLDSKKAEYHITVQAFSGNLKKGNNTIKNINDNIIINNG